jgi:REP element-mobilizing transposase RayT
MPRDDLLKGRVSIAHQAYHITTCTEARIAWFANFYCGRCVVNEMRQLDEKGILDSIAWAVMPDHVHWLFQLSDSLGLSEAMQRFKARSAIAIHRLLGRQDQIWQRGFHDHAIRRDEDLKAVARYIVANPLRAGLVQKIGDYPLWDAKWL